MKLSAGEVSVRPPPVVWAVVGVLASVAVACAPAAQRQADTPPLAAAVPGPTATPDFALTTIDGGMFRLAEQRGHVVGLFVMASWCGTCIPEAQAWERLANELGPQGLSVVAVSGDPGDTADDVRRFAALAKAQRPIWTLDPKAEFVHLFQVRSLDTTLIFDRSGKLVYRDAIPTPYDVLRREVEKVL